MKFLYAISAFLIIPIASFGQDLDDIFEDGDKETSIQIGTSLFTFAGGVPNVYIDYQPIEMLNINLGGGIIPFNTHRDYTLFSALMIADIPMVDTALTGGNYFTASLCLLSNYNFTGDFDFYYYIQYRRKNYTMINDYFKVRTQKTSFGVGYLFGLSGRFGLDMRVGIYLGRDKAYIAEGYDLGIQQYYNFRNVSFNDLDDITYERYPGLDFSIGINFSL